MYEIVRYNDKEHKQAWDDFIEKDSINGCFLQSRAFLDYHPKDRFNDHSLIVYYKSQIIAVIPGCIMNDATYSSHAGSTFGGFVVNEKFYSSYYVRPLIEEVEAYLKEIEIKNVHYKLTSDLFSSERGDLLQYLLFLNGYVEYSELSTYVDLTSNIDLLKSLPLTRRQNIRTAIEQGLNFKEVKSLEEIKTFYELLKITLEKFDTEPIHSFEEIMDLYENRIPQNIRFLVLDKEEKIVAGSMVFVSGDIIHTQYLASDPAFTKLGVMPYLYYCLIRWGVEEGFKHLSWGISTTERGRVLNEGLLWFKESFGSRHICNKGYAKKL